MKRLSGGAVLLNLSAISLGITAGEVSITDAGILGELTELRNFIDVNRDFSKGFKNLKPVLIEYRSSASKFNGIALGNLSFNTDALHMSIGINTIQSDGKMLIVAINVVYEWIDYVGYQVKTAKLNAYETLATGDGTFTGDVGVGGDLDVTGDITITGDAKIYENIVDQNGNKRFIEGDITMTTIEGITQTYGKWSLSGSHLMIVLAFNVVSGTSLAGGSVAPVNVPNWVKNKIYPLFGVNVERKTISAWGEDTSTQNLICTLQKVSDSLIIYLSSITFDKDRFVRISYDLLIDDEIIE